MLEEEDVPNQTSEHPHTNQRVSSFTFIDAQYRSIFPGVIAIGWRTYLGFLNRRAEMAEAAERIATLSESGGRKQHDEMKMPQRDTRKIEA